MPTGFAISDSLDTAMIVLRSSPASYTVTDSVKKVLVYGDGTAAVVGRYKRPGGRPLEIIQLPGGFIGIAETRYATPETTLEQAKSLGIPIIRTRSKRFRGR